MDPLTRRPQSPSPVPEPDTSRWTVPDLIDFDYYVEADERELREGGAEARKHLAERDRKLYLERVKSKVEPAEEHAPAHRSAALRRWLGERRKQEDTALRELLPGASFARGQRLVTIGLGIIGVLTGGSIASALLSYDGTHPVNVAWYLFVLVLLQVLLVGGTLTAWYLRRSRPVQTAVRDFSLLSHLIRPAFSWVSGWVQRQRLAHVPPEVRDRAKARSGLIQSHYNLYGPASYLPMLVPVQVFGICFNIGAIIVTIALEWFTDLAFGWGSALDVSPQTIHGLTQFIALPWSWLFGEGSGYPTLEQVAGSRIYLKDSLEWSNPEHLRSWRWFLVLGVIAYGLVPRLLMLGLSIYTQRRTLAKLPFTHQRTQALYARMVTPVLETATSGSGEGPEMPIPGPLKPLRAPTAAPRRQPPTKPAAKPSTTPGPRAEPRPGPRPDQGVVPQPSQRSAAAAEPEETSAGEPAPTFATGYVAPTPKLFRPRASKPAVEGEAAHDAVAGTESRIDARPAPKPKPEPAPDTKSERKPKPEPVSELKPLVEPKPEPAPVLQPKPEPGLEPKPEPRPEAEPVPEPQPEPEREPTLEPEPEVRLEPERGPQPEGEPKRRPERAPKRQPELKPEPEVEPELAPAREQTPEKEPEQEPEPQPEPEPRPESEARPGPEAPQPLPIAKRAIAADACVLLLHIDVADVLEEADHARLQQMLRALTGWQVAESVTYGGGSAMTRQAIELIEDGEWRAPPPRIALIQDGSQPPITEHLRFLRAVRAAAGDYAQIVLALVGDPDGDDPLPPVDLFDFGDWQRKIEQMADPYLRLEMLAAAEQVTADEEDR